MRIDFATQAKNKYNTEEVCRRYMNSQSVALGIFVVLFASSLTVLLLGDEDEAAATEYAEPNKTDVKITEFKVENTKWKKGGLADE